MRSPVIDMNTPICDFVAEYIKKNSMRLHMPGHKGALYLGCEKLDITEIAGADSLYEAEGIICESEHNASGLFASRTFYSTEGSSHAIRAMLMITCRLAKANGKMPLIWAGRNAHTVFLSAAVLLDFDVEWLYSESSDNYLSCSITASELEHRFKHTTKLPTAVYITSPDYLGNMSDIKSLSEVCQRYGVLLLVDNAHGAYLRFLPCSTHPIDLGADMCCDSAHKTLPVLTGGAYLHLSEKLCYISDTEVREALRLFGSTSPSYLILQSLDLANRYLSEEFPKELKKYLPFVEATKNSLAEHGFCLVGTEPMKLTIETKSYGYTGTEIAEILLKSNISVEFSDPDYVVFMLSPILGEEGLHHLTDALTSIPRKEAIKHSAPNLSYPKIKMSIRDAALSPFEVLPAEQCCNRILSQASVGCPPAVPIVVSGEQIDENSIRCFDYYGIKNCKVVK